MLVMLVLGFGCAEQTPFEEQFRSALETAQPGEVIEIPEGTFTFDRSLVMNIDGVTIRGQGLDKTVLSFKGQLAGAEGLSVSASDFTIEDLAIEDTVGDALKVNEGSNIIIVRVRTEWTNGPDVKKRRLWDLSRPNHQRVDRRQCGPSPPRTRAFTLGSRNRSSFAATGRV